MEEATPEEAVDSDKLETGTAEAVLSLDRQMAQTTRQPLGAVGITEAAEGTAVEVTAATMPADRHRKLRPQLAMGELPEHQIPTESRTPSRPFCRPTSVSATFSPLPGP